jgi:hypothetical protein
MAHYLHDIGGNPHYYVDGSNGYTLDGEWAFYVGADDVIFSPQGRPLFYLNDFGDLCGYDRAGVVLYVEPDADGVKWRDVEGIEPRDRYGAKLREGAKYEQQPAQPNEPVELRHRRGEPAARVGGGNVVGAAPTGQIGVSKQRGGVHGLAALAQFFNGALRRKR